MGISHVRKKLYVRKVKTIGAMVNPEEYSAIQSLAHKHGVTVSAFVRAIITDALVEEGFDARRFRSPGNTQGRESLEASGNPRQ